MESIVRLQTVLADAPFSSEDFIKKLVPNGWSLLINLLALLVTFTILYFLAYKPVKKYLKARQDAVKKNIDDAEEAKRVAQATITNRDAIIRDANEQAVNIVNKAKDDGEKKRQEIVKAAEDEAEKKLEQARESIKQEEIASREAIKKEIVDVAMDISQAVLPREITEEDNKRMLNELTNQLEEK